MVLSVRATNQLRAVPNYTILSTMLFIVIINIITEGFS